MRLKMRLTIKLKMREWTLRASLGSCIWKIGEGGQAKIFLATIFGTFQKLVAKVFKRNVSLKDLEQQWPCEMISQEFAAKSLTWTPFENVQGGVFTRNGVHRNRFAFVLREEWCALSSINACWSYFMITNMGHLLVTSRTFITYFKELHLI